MTTASSNGEHKLTWEEQREADQKQAAIDAREFDRMADAVALLLNFRNGGKGKRMEHMEQRAELYGPDGQQITLSGDIYGHKDKVTAYGVVPREDGNGVMGTESIRMSKGKAPAQIARDIQRRLLPGYVIALGKAREKARAVKEYNDNKSAALVRLWKASGRVEKLNDREERDCKFRASDFDLEVQVNGDSATIELRYINLDLAEKIIKAARALAPKKGG